jgi:tRNA1Val (adenine37-N6)-methyltransferase
MKVGTDGVLLGAWVDVSAAGRILDVGTGTGIIALMCAQRSENSMIDAVEEDPNASAQASENCKKSKWTDRITVVNNSIQYYASVTDRRYDLIVSNPPFFRNSLKPPVNRRSLARHDDNLSLESLFHHCGSLLTANGIIALIFPAIDIDFADRNAYFNGMNPLRKTFVSPYEGKHFSRCLVEYTCRSTVKCVTDELIIKKRAGSEVTGSFRELTKEFYLKF